MGVPRLMVSRAPFRDKIGQKHSSRSSIIALSGARGGSRRRHQQEAQRPVAAGEGSRRPQTAPNQQGQVGSLLHCAVPGGTETCAHRRPISTLAPHLTHCPPPKPFRAFHHPMPPSYNPCPVAARLSLRRVPGPRPAPGPGLTNTDCVFHPAAPVAHCRHLRHLHHHLHHQRQQPLAVPSTTTFQLRPRSPLHPTPSTLCIAQSPFATMASATSFYDFKPVDSEFCYSTRNTLASTLMFPHMAIVLA